MKTSFLLLSYAVSTAFAGDLYYAFFNDNQCKAGEGKHVDSTNSGCLREIGRKSVRPAGGHAGLYYPVLIGYSDDHCGTEIGCNAMPACDNPECCVDLTSQGFAWAQKAQSFRFESHGAKAASCPNACTGECPGGHPPHKRDTLEIDAPVEKVEEREIVSGEELARRHGRPGHGYYAYCSDDNCMDCGEGIKPATGGCSVEGSRKSVYNSGNDAIGISGYRSPGQDCKGAVVDTITMHGKGCNKIKSGADGGATSWQVTTFGKND